MATGCGCKEHLFYRFPLDSVTSFQIYGYDNQPTNQPTQMQNRNPCRNENKPNNTMKCVMNEWLDDLSFYYFSSAKLKH